MQTISFSRAHLPVLITSDLVVAGGSFAGISAALELARAGFSVVLIESRTYLGFDVTATLRPWIPCTMDGLSKLPEVVRECVESSHATLRAGEYPLHPDAVKTRLEDLILDAGIRLLYASQPVGVSAHGLVIGNKSGRQVLTCRMMLDATPTALVARLSGAAMQQPGEHAIYSITLEFDEVAFQECEDMIENIPEIPMPPRLGVVGNRLVTHRGHRSGSHAYRHGHNLFECSLELPAEAVTALAHTQRYLLARKKAIDVASYLLWENPYFRLAHLASLSQDLYGPQASPMLAPSPDWAQPFAGAALPGEIALPCLAAPMAGVWCLNEAARMDGSLFRDPISGSELGAAFGMQLARHWDKLPAQSTVTEPAVETIPSGRMHIKEPDSPQRGRNYPQSPAPALPIPVLADVDVLVAGGGTSGTIAAIAAAGEGVRTVVVEMSPGLGGTATYGGVHEYWAGWQSGFMEQSTHWVNKMHDRLRYPPAFGRVGEWNVEAKIEALVEETQRCSVEMLCNALIIGAIIENHKVRGIVTATPLGPAALLGQITIDATGDGDVAAFAGASFAYGSLRDHAAMWYSLPQFASPGFTNNNFSGMVDVSNIQDYTRAILAGRRRGGEIHDHGAYIAPRESRHIVGDVTQTLTDQLLQRAWTDVVSIAVSNNDIKGQISSDWMRAGLIPPNLEIEISYRMLLPLGLENILVVGKAISAAHDALPSIRMQADFENLGGASGLAAALAVRSDLGLREIDVHALQEHLVQIGVLPSKVLTRHLLPRWLDDATLKGMINQLMTDDRPLHAYSKMELNEVFHGPISLVEACTAGARAIPLLEKALAGASGTAKVHIAQALCLVGSRAGVNVLVTAIQEQLAGGKLPPREAFIQHVDHFAPDQAAMPDTAYLVYSLGMAADRRALPVWQRIVDLLADLSEEDVWSQNKGVFAYVDAVCCGAERLGDPAAVPILQQLHSYKPFQNKIITTGFQANYLKERPAYLEVVIGRALARCASPDGVLTLINYLADVRTLLAEQAHDELAAISGKDFGKDASAWSQWLEAEGDRLRPTPWTASLDAVAAWGESVLVQSDD